MPAVKRTLSNLEISGLGSWRGPGVALTENPENYGFWHNL